MPFTNEKELVEIFKNSQYFENLVEIDGSISREEVKGFFGVPDLVIIQPTGEKQISYAFEAKLSNWKRALFQAFRYKAFVNKSFVVMDHDLVKPALSQTDRFCRANIGLISIDLSGEVHCHYNPYYEPPYSPQLESKFNEKIRDSGEQHTIDLFQFS